MTAEKVTMGWVHVVAVACFASLIHASLLPINDDLDSRPPFRSLGKRQRDDSRCGKNFGEAPCASDECCSAEGWCGKGYDYCSAPACQINYGPACDGNIRPSGADTSDIPRPKRGRVPYGEGIYSCTQQGAIALTYDDGPYEYTAHLLDLLQAYSVKATFFITGNNLGKGAINDPSKPWRSLVSRMLSDGHQVASHTFSHQRLTELSQPQLRRQMVYNEIAIADILGGRFPTYMRPPYSASDAKTDAWLGDLGYHIVYFNLDTQGYLHTTASEIGDSKKIWDDAVENANPRTVKFLQIEHDIVYQAVYNLTEYMLSSMRRKGIKGITVGDCLNDPPSNWYRSLGRDGGGGGGDDDDGSDDDQTDKPRPLPPTKDGRCGPNHGGQTCEGEAAGSTCCSGKGWCGSTGEHCGKACQPVYGKCNE